MIHKAIETEELGIISGRDAIFIDRFSHTFEGGVKCVLKGEINLDLVEKGEKYMAQYEAFVPYTLIFQDVVFFQCFELDSYKHEKNMVSSFDMIEDASALRSGSRGTKLNASKLYVVQTYDFVYEIMASDYCLKLPA